MAIDKIVRAAQIKSVNSKGRTVRSGDPLLDRNTYSRAMFYLQGTTAAPATVASAHRFGGELGAVNGNNDIIVIGACSKDDTENIHHVASNGAIMIDSIQLLCSGSLSATTLTSEFFVLRSSANTKSAADYGLTQYGLAGSTFGAVTINDTIASTVSGFVSISGTYFPMRVGNVVTHDIDIAVDRATINALQKTQYLILEAGDLLVWTHSAATANAIVAAQVPHVSVDITYHKLTPGGRISGVGKVIRG